MHIIILDNNKKFVVVMYGTILINIERDLVLCKTDLYSLLGVEKNNLVPCKLC